MLLPYSPEIALAEVGSEERAGLEEQAGRVPTAKVVRMIEALGEALSRVKRGVDVKLELELTFLKLARDYTEPSVEDLISRIEALEMVIANDGTPELRIEREEPALHTSDDRGEEPQEEPEGDNGGEADRAPGQKPERPHGRESEESGTMGEPRFDLDWVSLLHELRRRRQVPAAAFYESARIASYDDGVLKIVFPKEMKALAKHAGDPRRLTPLQEVLEERLGERPRVEFGIADTDDQSGEPSETSGKTPSISRTETGIQSDTASEMDSEESRTGGHHQRTDSDPVSGNEPDTSSGITHDTRGGVNGADSTIQDPREVFIMARERFGSDGKEKRDG
jgi:DNA polymerase-3 subunit gamma/tau